MVAVKIVFLCYTLRLVCAEERKVTFNEKECPMRSGILALLAPAAIAITASASAAVPASRASIIESSPVTIDVAYRYARGTTVRLRDH